MTHGLSALKVVLYNTVTVELTHALYKLLIHIAVKEHVAVLR